jgi:hypothetical protein
MTILATKQILDKQMFSEQLGLDNCEKLCKFLCIGIVAGRNSERHLYQ